MEGRVLACSIGMACRLYRDLFRDTPTIIDKEINIQVKLALLKSKYTVSGKKRCHFIFACNSAKC